MTTRLVRVRAKDLTAALIVLGLAYVPVGAQAASGLSLPLIGGSRASIQEFPIPSRAGGPCDIVADKTHNALWFIETVGGKVGRIDAATGDVLEFPTTSPTSFPAGVSVAPDGGIWFAEMAGNHVSRIDPVTYSRTDVMLPTPGAVPIDLAITDDGSVWVGESSPTANKLARIRAGDSPGSGVHDSDVHVDRRRRRHRP